MTACCTLWHLQALEGLVAHLVSHMPLLLRLVDNVALLDMLLAFADTCASAAPDQPYVRPQLHRHGHTLAIVQVRH
jgi:DNA mismatch repair ATPase MutS